MNVSFVMNERKDTHENVYILLYIFSEWMKIEMFILWTIVFHMKCCVQLFTAYSLYLVTLMISISFPANKADSRQIDRSVASAGVPRAYNLKMCLVEYFPNQFAHLYLYLHLYRSLYCCWWCWFDFFYFSFFGYFSVCLFDCFFFGGLSRVRDSNEWQRFRIEQPLSSHSPIGVVECCTVPWSYQKTSFFFSDGQRKREFGLVRLKSE